MLKITDVARDKIKELMQEHPDRYLRIVFEGFGWGGPRLGLALDELKNDQQFHTVNDIDLLIEESILPFTKDRQVNYIDNQYGKGFSISAASSANCWLNDTLKAAHSLNRRVRGSFLNMFGNVQLKNRAGHKAIGQ